MEFNYKLDGNIYPVIIEKKNNKNTYIRVKEDLTIQVTTNYLVPKWQIKSLLNSNKDYLIKTIAKRNKQKKRNENFYYLGQKYDIILVPFDNVEIEGHKIYTPSIEKLNKWIKKQTKQLFKKRLDYNYQLFEENIPYPPLKIRSMKTRWGVCNKRDNSVTINSKLIEYTVEELDYVIIHELSHFVHFNHSKQFWKTVEKYCPNYGNIKQILQKEVE